MLLIGAPTGNSAHNPGMCPDWESNWQPFGLQAGTQSTEPHQPGLYLNFLKKINIKKRFQLVFRTALRIHMKYYKSLRTWCQRKSVTQFLFYQVTDLHTTQGLLPSWRSLSNPPNPAFMQGRERTQIGWRRACGQSSVSGWGCSGGLAEFCPVSPEAWHPHIHT